jgi:hypothetical protein
VKSLLPFKTGLAAVGDVVVMAAEFDCRGSLFAVRAALCYSQARVEPFASHPKLMEKTMMRFTLLLFMVPLSGAQGRIRAAFDALVVRESRFA